MTKIEDHKPTLGDLIDIYTSIVRDDVREGGDVPYTVALDNTWKAGEKAEAEINAALAPLAHELMAKLPHGKQYVRDVATLIREETKDNRRRQAEAEAAGYPDYRTMSIAKSEADAKARRVRGARRAAASRAGRDWRAEEIDARKAEHKAKRVSKPATEADNEAERKAWTARGLPLGSR